MDMISDPVETAPAAAAAEAAPKGGIAEAAKSANLTQAIRWRTPVLAAPHASGQPRNPSLPTFVGLIMLILTFFIVLTSVSLRDQRKSDAAMASLQDAFSGNAPTNEAPTEDEDAVAREYIAGLTDRLHSLVPLMGGKPAPAADHQVLWLPIGLAFASESAALDPMFPTILREAVASLASVPQRFTPHLEMRLCADQASDLLRQRALAIGAALSAERAPMQQLAIGVARCDPARVGIAIALSPTAEEPVP
jgi:hypothetical protein